MYPSVRNINMYNFNELQEQVIFLKFYFSIKPVNKIIYFLENKIYQTKCHFRGRTLQINILCKFILFWLNLTLQRRYFLFSFAVHSCLVGRMLLFIFFLPLGKCFVVIWSCLVKMEPVMWYSSGNSLLILFLEYCKW